MPPCTRLLGQLFPSTPCVCLFVDFLNTPQEGILACSPFEPPCCGPHPSESQGSKYHHTKVRKGLISKSVSERTDTLSEQALPNSVHACATTRSLGLVSRIPPRMSRVGLSTCWVNPGGSRGGGRGGVGGRGPLHGPAVGGPDGKARARGAVRVQVGWQEPRALIRCRRTPKHCTELSLGYSNRSPDRVRRFRRLNNLR